MTGDDFTSAVPDIYADGFNITVGPYGVTIDLSLSEPELPPNRPGTEPVARHVGRLRLSPQLALVLADYLTRNMAAYQEQIGEITLPDALVAPPLSVTESRRNSDG